MQTLTFQNHSIPLPEKVISQNQPPASRRGHMKCAVVRDAVAAWEAALPGKAQEEITKKVVAEWRRRGGTGLNLAGSVQNAKQNLFRWLDNPRGSEKYERYITTLMPVIADVMPIEIARKFGLKQGMTEAELVANAIKECGEVQQAKIQGLSVKALEREAKEAMESILRLLPVESIGPLMDALASFAPGCM